mmetsp:Transcript_16940/g.23912  ORF Transcript_16940/g.23912 Transcript_16940/m.23912 type:complete len:325 (+) Transcript_16940:360-1334(+)
MNSSNILQSFEDRDECRTEQVGKKLLDNKNRILTEWVDNLHSKLSREGLQWTSKDGNDEQMPTQGSPSIGVKVCIAQCQCERSKNEHCQDDKVILARMIGPSTKDQTGKHDEQLEGSSDNTDVGLIGSIQCDKVVHEGTKGVDNDTRGGESYDTMSKSLTGKACLELLNDLIITNVNVQMMIELSQDRFSTLILFKRTRRVVISISFKESIVIMSLSIVTVVECRNGGGLLHLSLLVGSGRWRTIVTRIVHGHGRVLSRGRRRHGMSTRLHHECLHGSFLLFLSHIIKLLRHWFIRGSRRGCSIDSTEFTTLFFLGNLCNELIH